MTSLVLQLHYCKGKTKVVQQHRLCGCLLATCLLSRLLFLRWFPGYRIETLVTERGGREIGKFTEWLDEVGNKGGCKRRFDTIISQERRVEPRY